MKLLKTILLATILLSPQVSANPKDPQWMTCNMSSNGTWVCCDPTGRCTVQ